MKQFVVLLLLVSTVAQAQDVMETMAKETCDCIKAKNLDLKNVSSENLQTEFGICAMSIYGKHKEAYDKISPSDIGDSDSMKKFGESLAIKMLSTCPEIIMGLANDTPSLEPVTALTIEGTVVEFVTEQFVTIKVKDKNQRLHSFILLDYFDTASLYTDGIIKKKDNVIVSYSEIELYDAKTKEFRYYKVISGLERK